MIEIIKQCKRCNLCNNQKPLLDKYKESSIIWLGLSAKKVEGTKDDIPLAPNTNSGELIATIEAELNDISTYKSNFVKCAPLDDNGKLRYPTKDEMDRCFENLLIEIEDIKPKIVFLLGSQVTKSIEKNLKIKFSKSKAYEYRPLEKNGIMYIPIYHPSYIKTYRRKELDLYTKSIVNITNNIIKEID